MSADYRISDELCARVITGLAKHVPAEAVAADLRDARAAYDALLAERDDWRGRAERQYDANVDLIARNGALEVERDALKAELDDQREAYRKTIEDECATDEKHCACVPFLRSEVKRISDECDEGRCPSAEHERLAAAALKERAKRVQEKLRDSFVDSDGCDLCDLEWPYSHDEQHAPDCPAHPDFLTTSATESREAKGGTT